MSYQKIITELIDEHIIHGAVIMAGCDKEVHLHEAFGEARDGIGMRTDSIFDIASITKPMATASACAICMDRGLLNFDNAVTYYLPECIGKISDKVTVRHLATHTSGMSYSPFTSESQTPEEIFNTLNQEIAPDQIWEYSCYEYILLGLIVERVTGEKLDTFCADNLFTPLGMTDTAFGPIECCDRVTKPETPETGQISDPNARFMSDKGRATGNAGVFSTTHDLAIFCDYLLNNDPTLLGKAALSELTSNNIPNPKIPPHSFGWNMNPAFHPHWMSESTIYHSGWTGNTVWIDTECKTWFVILSARYGDYTKAKQKRLEIANCFSISDKMVTPNI